MTISASQWTRIDEPVLDLAAVRVVEIDGVIYLTDDTSLPEAGRLVSINGVLYLEIYGE